MNKYHALPLALLFATLTPQAVANRCAGEFSEPVAIAHCACTVQNRIQAGWSQWRVLSAYYAPDALATPADVATVAAVLDGTTACGDEYFMLSKADTIMLGIDHIEPVLTVRRGGQEVRFFERRFRERK
jgi:hypothetical protein